VEPLEERLVPTVVFDPQFAKETVPGTAPYTVLNSPTVYLIFWGTGWGTGQLPGPSAVSTLTKDAKAVFLNNSYFGGLSEDGNVGTPVFGGAWTDASSDPPAGFNVGAASAITADQGEIATAITNNPSWTPLTQLPIYVVVPVGGTAGYNDQGAWTIPGTTIPLAINICSVGGASSSTSSSPVQDWFTQTFSHELEERITDPTDGGVTVNYPTDSTYPGYISSVYLDVNNSPSANVWDPGFGDVGYANNGGQIGDGEQELGGQAHYGYRLNGVKVQSLLSANTPDVNGNAGAFVVPDGNSESIYLDPIWATGTIPGSNPAVTGPYFTGSYNLTIKGDHQSSTAANDTITINAADAQVKVTLDGQNFVLSQFTDGGQIQTITVEAGGGTNTVNIQGLASDQTLNVDSTGADTVNVGSASRLTGFQGKMNLYNNGSQALKLSVDDSKDSTGRTVTQTANSQTFFTTMTWSSLGSITYAPGLLTALALKSGSGANVFTFAGTTSGCTTTIDTGYGDDNLSFQSTSGPLIVTSSASKSLVAPGQDVDTVTVGSPTPTLNGDSPLFGPVTVSNPAGRTSLTVDDSADAYPGLTFTFSSNSLTSNSPLGAPAKVTYGAGVNSLDFRLGSGSDTVNVLGLGTSLTIDASTGTDRINLGDPYHNLYAVSNVTVHGNWNTRLTVDDRGNKVGLFGSATYTPMVTQYSVSGQTLTRVATALIVPFPVSPMVFGSTVQYGGLAGLTLYGGSVGPYTYQIDSTAGTNSFVVNAASSADIVTVGEASANLLNVTNLTINGNGNTAVTVDDRGNVQGLLGSASYTPVLTQYSVGRQKLVRVEQAVVTPSLLPEPNLFVSTLNYRGLSSLTVTSGPATTTTYQIDSTAGTNSLVIQANSPQDIVAVGEATANLNNVSNLTITGNGNTVVTVDDRGNKPAVTGGVSYTPLVTQYFLGAQQLSRVVQALVVPSVLPEPNIFGTRINYSNLSSLTIDGGKTGLYTYQIDSTAGAGPVTINAIATPDIVGIGEPGHNLDAVGPVKVNGDGSTQLVVDDEANQNQTISTPAGAVAVTTSPTYGLTSSSVTRTNSVTQTLQATGQVLSTATIVTPITFGNLAALTVHGGASANVFNVVSTGPGTTLQAGNGGDQVNLGSATSNLDGIHTLTVQGGTGTILNLDDEANHNRKVASEIGIELIKTSPAYVITDQAVTRTNVVTTTLLGTGQVLSSRTLTATINYSNLAGLTVHGGSSGNSFSVQATAAGTPTTVIAGTGTDVINVGSTANVLDGLHGPLIVNGRGGTTSLNVNDQGTTISQDYYVFADSIHRVAPVSPFADDVAPIQYHQVGTVVLNMGSAQTGANPREGGGVLDATYVYGTAAGTTTTVNGGPAGEDLFWIAPFDYNPTDQILGPVHCYGGNALNALYYYDYLDPQAQTYTLTAGQILVSGAAPVTYDSKIGGGVSLYTAALGGSHVNALGTSGAWTAIAANTGDVITVGSLAPALGGTLANLGYNLTISTNGPTQSATVILDDSGDTQTGKQVTFNQDWYAWGVSGLSANRIYFGLGTGSSIQVLDGQSGGNTYTIQSVPAGIALSINGLPAGLVSLWKGDGNTTDFLGKNNGTLQPGVTFGPGMTGASGDQAFSFDGSNGSVDLGHDPSLNITGSLTVSAWVNVQSLNHPKYLFADFDSTGHLSQGSLGILATGQFFWFQGNQGIANDWVEPFGATRVNLNQWYQVAVVRDDTAKTITLYVNGVPDGSVSCAGIPVLPLQGDKLLGGAGPGFPQDAFSGLLDEVGFFNRALSAAEIQLIYKLGTSSAVGTAGTGDTFNIGSAANTLDPIQGMVSVTGHGGSSTLNFNDQGGTPGTAPNQAYNYSLAGSSFTRTGTATVTFSGLGAVNLYAANVAGSGGFNDLGVASTAPGTTYSLYAGTGLNEFIVADLSYTLNGIQGPLFLHGAGGSLPNDDLVALYDVDKTTRHTFYVNAGATPQSGTVERANTATNQYDMAPINYDGLNAYSVMQTAGSGGATINIQSQAAALFSAFYVATGDTVNISSTGHTMAGILGDLRIAADVGQTPRIFLDDSGDSNPKTIDLRSDGVNGYLVSGLLPSSSLGRGRLWLELDPATPVTLKTGSGDDAFRIHDLVGVPSLVLDAGGGTNTLDYSAYVGDVTVDLLLGFATGLAGITNIQNVIGSQGNDLLVGDANANVLIGGTGRNILIGGAGADTLTGGGGDNILIGGTTAYDQNLAALNQIMQEWLQPSDFATRMAAIQNGTDLLAGTGFHLAADTVFSDGAANVLNPGPGNNWLFP
jgi:hypothetical protein